jgi:hypothetical protein
MNRMKNPRNAKLCMKEDIPHPFLTGLIFDVASKLPQNFHSGQIICDNNVLPILINHEAKITAFF